jgi:hypothetical protein
LAAHEHRLTLFSSLAVIALIAGAVVFASFTASAVVAPGVAQAADRDCSDFNNQRRAQRFFREHNPRRDPHGLDADNDGVACESLPCPCSRKARRQGSATAGFATAARQKFVTHRCVSSTRRPSRIILTCADGGRRLVGLRWRSWGGQRARGSGALLQNNCRPSCAGGSFRRHRLEKVTLMRARPCGNTGGRLHYRRVSYRFAGNPPRGSQRVEGQRLFCPF